MPINNYLTTKEVAERLGLSHGAVRNAVARGVIAVKRLGKQNLVAVEEVERYVRERLGRGGWDTRKQEGYTPNTAHQRAQHRYYEKRKKEQRRQQPERES